MSLHYVWFASCVGRESLDPILVWFATRNKPVHHQVIVAKQPTNSLRVCSFRLSSCLVSKKFYKIFQILRHIESLDACIYRQK